MGGIVLRAHHLIQHTLHILLTEATEANHLLMAHMGTVEVVMRLVRIEVAEVAILADHNQEQDQEENIFIQIRL